MTNDEEKNFKKKALKVINTNKDIKQKVFELLDKSLSILEDEVNNLKFRLSHNKISDEELQAIYDELEKSTQI
tara:strand:- start:51 stop:269 length:219 start_codon:yes stop_codon:yes gene_type:complete